MDAVTRVPAPRNEPVLTYAPGSAERAALEARLAELAAEPIELTSTIGGRQRMASGEKFEVVQPHRHAAVLGTSAHATHADAQDALRAAKEAAPAWQELSFDDRAAVFLKAADLLAGPWRQTLNAATMLGQSKTSYQAEIDAACELIDFWRYNVHFARQIMAEQPEVAPADRDLAGIHFTGSTPVFQHLWRTVGENIASYRGYPRIVGETGGKDFVVAHASADVDVLRTALIRGAFEFQGQKCSAASRAYVPRSVWTRLRDDLVATTESLSMGDVTDLSNFMGAVIDRKSFSKLSGVLDRAKDEDALTVVAGGTADDSEGFFVRPTIIEGTDPGHEVFSTEYFGPVLAVHVYEDAEYDTVLTQMESVAPYALTGSVIAQDRAAIAHAQKFLRNAAGNFYVNDKPTGAVVGQQPFGGGRASGTNDKAGAPQNLMRWTSPRSIKETFVPATDHSYPHMG